MTSDHPRLARGLGTGDAVVIGIGSMVGAGVYSAFGPAAEAAGSALILGLALAALVATCNATSSAQLAAQYPESGGTYVYGRERLGPWWGFVAGWGFVIGKTASCAAMALTFAAYVAPPPWRRVVAIAAVVGLVALASRGVTRTARATAVIVVLSLAALTATVGLVLAGGAPEAGRLDVLETAREAGWQAVLQSAGLLFFAFAGYARVATMGEEVREPARTIPRAILIALGVVLVLYVGVALTLLATLGAGGVASSQTPVADALAAAGWPGGRAGIGLAAAVASLGALLALLTGVSRTVLAMARTGDLPGWLSAVHPRHQVPHRAELLLGMTVCMLVATSDLRGAIGFSSFGVLLYYLVANAAALTQPAERRRFPRVLQVLGAVGCAALALALPVGSVVAGVVVLVVGVLYRVVRQRLAGPARP